jgi:hypothetical protein
VAGVAETFDAKVLGAHHALDAAGLAHALGGAIALGYYAVPRATVDIDLNVFVNETQAGAALVALAARGVDTAGAEAQIARSGQCRVMWDRTPVDLFFTNMAFHEAMARSVRQVPFAGEPVPILSAEHLLVCKALFDRHKDWLDIEQMLVSLADLRVAEVRRWMVEIAGEDDGRTTRLDALIREMLAR